MENQAVAFFSALAIYLFYFHHIIFNANSLLSSITGDALKNYYTYSFHIVNDSHPLHFAGMHYPFGEHVVYTDCQPALTLILRCFPFTHNHLIGIMHLLIFLSFIVTPLFLYSILREFKIDAGLSFCGALAIAMLSPQFVKINHGHHGLAYGCVIPIVMLLIVRMSHTLGFKYAVSAFIFNTFLFLIHPYLGFGLSVFAFIALLCLAFFSSGKNTKIRLFSFAVLAGILPVLFFKIFMFFTDQHVGRTSSPYGGHALVENINTIINPDFGPFAGIFNSLLPERTVHFEGHSYLGMSTILLGLLLLGCLPFVWRRLKFKKEVIALFVPAFFLMLFSFGLHVRLFNFLNIEVSAIAQFRAVCRFAWFVYFALPILLIVTLHQMVLLFGNANRIRLTVRIAGLLLFLISLLEAHFYFNVDKDAFWKFENVFNKKGMSPLTRQLISKINERPTQAILALPLFYNGSEMFDRGGRDLSMIPAMIFSFHSGLPIIGSWMSRTSIPETEQTISLLNSYDRENKPPLQKEESIAIVLTADNLYPDEERLIRHWHPFFRNDSLSVGYMSVSQFLSRKTDEQVTRISADSSLMNNDVFYIPAQARKPFITSDLMDYEKITTLDSNIFLPGEYRLSLHYHPGKLEREAFGNLIITRGSAMEFSWLHNYSLSELSGFYNGFYIFEKNFIVEKGCRYEFLVKGNFNKNYRVSHFMIRSKYRTIVSVKNSGDSLINNYPLSK